MLSAELIMKKIIDGIKRGLAYVWDDVGHGRGGHHHEGEEARHTEDALLPLNTDGGRGNH